MLTKKLHKKEAAQKLVNKMTSDAETLFNLAKELNSKHPNPKNITGITASMLFACISLIAINFNFKPAQFAKADLKDGPPNEIVEKAAYKLLHKNPQFITSVLTHVALEMAASTARKPDSDLHLLTAMLKEKHVHSVPK